MKNNFDKLLEWASEVGSGRWSHWKETCLFLGLNPTGAARTLSDLGHVEFDWVQNVFGTVPPMAILLPNSSGCLLFTGARPVGMWERVTALFEDLNFGFDVYLHPPIKQNNGPETWLCEIDMADAKKFCAFLGIDFQIHSGFSLADRIDIPALELVGVQEPPSRKFDRAWFDIAKHVFSPCASENQDGWWRVSEARRVEHFIHLKERWWRITIREYAPFFALPFERLLTYSKSKKEFLVEEFAPLPPLLARALTLQTGRLPKRTGKLCYANVEEPLANLIAIKTGSLLRTIE